jgi:hypothetical protein
VEHRRNGNTIRRRLAVAAALLALVVPALTACASEEGPVPKEPTAASSTPGGSSTPTGSSSAAGPASADSAPRDVTSADLAKVARMRVLFGHQSVGMNILDAVPGVFATHGLPAPTVQQDAVPSGSSGGFVVHAYLGRNEDPLSKIRDFEARIRGGLGDQVDVAMMKFCYVDIVGGTDVTALFDAYRRAMAGLERDYPRIVFITSTAPLMSEPGLLTRVKARVTGNDQYGAAENVARERFNALIRAEYASHHLFDLAAIESTAPDGTRVSGTYQGRPYFAMYDGYTTDRGHLNAEGAQRVATAWLGLISRVTTK